VSPAFFLDTNIFVYSFDRSQPRKQKRAQLLIAEAIESERSAISTQVIQEFLNVALDKFAGHMTSSEALAFLDRILWPLCKIHPSAGLYAGAASIKDETGWTFYDSLIVSAAAAARCQVLFTEDLQAERVVRGVEIRNPFA
jgi:predicted nucleic acid-binding protein